MAAEIMGQVLNTDLPGHLKLPLVALADWANHEGEAHPGQKAWSQHASVSDRQLRTAIRALEELGLLHSIREGRMMSNSYQIDLAVLEAMQPPKSDRKPTSGHSRKGRRDRKPTADQDRKPTADQDRKPTSAPLDTSVDTPKDTHAQDQIEQIIRPGEKPSQTLKRLLQEAS